VIIESFKPQFDNLSLLTLCDENVTGLGVPARNKQRAAPNDPNRPL
jgi:hypothetical protein